MTWLTGWLPIYDQDRISSTAKQSCIKRHDPQRVSPVRGDSVFDIQLLEQKDKVRNSPHADCAHKYPRRIANGSGAFIADRERFSGSYTAFPNGVKAHFGRKHSVNPV